MKWWKRALKSVLGKPGRSLILFLLIFTLGSFIAGTISVYHAIYNTDLMLREKAGAVATIDWDYDRMYSEGLSEQERNQIFLGERPNTDTIEQIGALPYVNYYDYSLLLVFQSELKTIDNVNPAFKSTTLPEPTDLKENKIRLIEGRTFSQQEMENFIPVVLISKQMAEMNHLSLGSKIPVRKDFVDYTKNEDEIVETHHYEFEVIGIYELTVPERQMDMGIGGASGLGTQGATIYTTDCTARTIGNRQIETDRKYDPTIEESDGKYYSNVYFVLNDPLDMEQFREEATAFLPDYYKITATSDFYQYLTAPMKSIQDVTDMLLYISVGAAVLILGLLQVLFLRDRRREIGIYLSLGERKKKIAAQLILEVISAAVIAIGFSLFTGNLLSSAISEQMIQQQVMKEQEMRKESESRGDILPNDSSNLHELGYSQAVNMEDILETYAVKLDGYTALLFYAVGIGTIILSMVLPITYIMRLNPKKILM